MNERFIPVEIYGKNNKRKIWYIDVGNMSYSQLIKLKQELWGTMSIRYVDRVISDYIGDVTYSIYNNKQRKRDEKNNNKLMIKRRSRFKRGR